MKINDLQSATVSESVKRLNPHISFDRAPSSAVAEPAVCHELLGQEVREGSDSKRLRVRVISYRRRLCDADNLCAKYFIDCLRYAEVIRDDAPQYIELSVSQQKVKGRENECTEIIVQPL